MSILRSCPRFYLVCLLAALLAAQPVAAQYTITDLGTLGGDMSLATGINKAGQVVGYSSIGGAENSTRAFLYANPGPMLDLGTLGGQNSSAFGINSGGHVVGESGQAFLYDGTTMIDLGTLPGRQGSSAFGVNDNDDVVGYSRSNDVPPHAFLYRNGIMMDLGTFGGGYGIATGINDAGAVVGYAQRADGNQRAFLFQQGIMNDLGTLGGAQSFANAINNQGQIVGYAETPSPSVNHAFLIQDGGMMDLDTLGTNYSIANAINDDGLVVGIARFPGVGLHAALFYNGAMIDLNTILPAGSGWELTEARGINDSGQIVGYGTFGGQYPRAFLLIPVPPPTVTCSLQEPLLWPPNDSLVNVGLGVTVNPADASLTVLVYANDEASPSDAANIGPGTLELRSERQGNGNGRIYLIITTASNIAGTSFDLCTVDVPHDNSPSARRAVDQDAAAAVGYYQEFRTPPPGFTLLQ